MRMFVQALIIIVGFSAAIATVRAEQSKQAVGNCYEMTAPNTPTICN